MRNYRNLDVWKASHDLTLRLYRATQTFPENEGHALTSQMRRASYSIPMNIAEGCGKSSEPDFRRYLDAASGSASELDYPLLLARDLEYLTTEQYQSLTQQLTHIRKMLTSLIKTVRAK